jgi:hypothetical protein
LPEQHDPAIVMAMSALRVAACTLAAVCATATIRRLSYHSGATSEEVHASLPGDDVIAHPMAEWTRAATIDASPSGIWPWLVQMGYGRGGWYTNERIDQAIWRTSAVNADHIVPELQTLAVGDIVADGPEHAAYFHVRAIEPERAIVYHSIRHPYRGHPLPDTEPARLEEMEQRLLEGGRYLDFSWAFVLAPAANGASRLIIRTRADYAPNGLAALEVPLGLVDLFHAHTILRGVAARAVVRHATEPARLQG